ncbi:MAG: polyribonucleotide nucleotidyltransferase, partial [Candidatus Caldatribacteriaceae bacterium]
FEERFYAAGKIPGGFIKREGKPRVAAILSARLIDRSIRPLFSEFCRNEIQVVVTVLSVDEIHPPDVISIIGASLALGISEIPFEGPVGACRMGLINEHVSINPTLDKLALSKMDMVIAGTREGITMIEAGAKEVDEERVTEAMSIGYQEIRRNIEQQEEIIRQIGKPKLELKVPEFWDSLWDWLLENYQSEMSKRITIPDKKTREQEMKLLFQKFVEEGEAKFGTPNFLSVAWEKMMREEVQKLILTTGHRQDGRTPQEIRPISCEVGFLPRTHGSSLFTRGQTQALVITTLGAKSEEQKVDGLQEEEAKRFMLHYNFPPYSTGEVRPLRGPGRREIG